MSEHQELLMLSLSFCVISLSIAYYFSNRVTKIQRDLLEVYRKRLEQDDDTKVTLLIYVLTDIHNRSVHNEDYETANQCLKSIQELKELSTKTK